MSEKWIKELGIVREEELTTLVNRVFHDDYYYLAGCTDAYCSGKGRANSFLITKASKLLEMRIFSSDMELHLSRSMVGQDFKWRLTSDETLEDCDYIDYEHYIDINPEESRKTEKGMNILSTVGGRYELPIESGDNVAYIRAYVTYDKNGMAKVKDHRVRGFGRKEV